MTMTINELNRRDNLLSSLKSIWDSMTNEERSAVEGVVNSIMLNHTERDADVESFYHPLTMDEMLAEIDKGKTQIAQGHYLTLEAAAAKHAAKYGFKRK